MKFTKKWAGDQDLIDFNVTSQTETQKSDQWTHRIKSYRLHWEQSSVTKTLLREDDYMLLEAPKKKTFIFHDSFRLQESKASCW